MTQAPAQTGDHAPSEPQHTMTPTRIQLRRVARRHRRADQLP